MNRRDNANERTKAKHARFLPHLRLLRRRSAMALEPLFIFVRRGSAPFRSCGIIKVAPHFANKTLWETVRRENYLANFAFGGFAQRLFFSLELFQVTFCFL